MNDRDIQHPDITEAERTGYPRRIIRTPIVECSVCGCEMVLNSITLEPVCAECLQIIEIYEGEESA